MVDCLYRYEAKSYASFDSETEIIYRGSMYLHLTQYEIIKYTPKGAWIKCNGRKRFVLLTARKKFACRNKKDALVSLLYRKRRQASIISSNLNNVKQAISICENKLKTNDFEPEVTLLGIYLK